MDITALNQKVIQCMKDIINFLICFIEMIFFSEEKRIIKKLEKEGSISVFADIDIDTTTAINAWRTWAGSSISMSGDIDLATLINAWRTYGPSIFMNSAGIWSVKSVIALGKIWHSPTAFQLIRSREYEFAVEDIDYQIAIMPLLRILDLRLLTAEQISYVPSEYKSKEIRYAAAWALGRILIQISVHSELIREHPVF